jgi:predicted dithiol-disulfide oxidoreductase (DUF899 family)
MKTPPVVPAQQWEAARRRLLVNELTLARDALAAERRRMPWLAVEQEYRFVGPEGEVDLLGLFGGRQQLVVHRVFFEPGVHGWRDHACAGCSTRADQVAEVGHLNTGDTTFVYVSRAPQPEITRVKARMGWTMPWYTTTDTFDADFGVAVRHGTNAFFRNGARIFRTSFLVATRRWAATRRDRVPGRQEEWEDSPDGDRGRRPTSGGTGTTKYGDSVPALGTWEDRPSQGR